MRYLLWVCALAATPCAAFGQQPDAAGRPVVTPDTSTADSLEPVRQSDCLWKGPGASAAQPPAGVTNDSLCLTRSEAITIALAHNPQLQIAAEQIAQAKARKVQGTAIPDPAFGAEFDQSRGPFGSGGAAGRSVNATLTIPFLDKFRLNGRIGTADVRSATFTSTLVRQTIVLQTSQTYDSLLAALRRRADLQEAHALAQEFARRTEARFTAGTAPKLDVIRAQVDVAQSENDLIANERDIINARAALNRLLGRRLAAPIAAADSLIVPAVPPDDVSRLEATALANRPELGDLKSQIEGSRATTALMREYWLPDLTVGVSRDYADPGPGVLFTGVSLPVPLFFWQHSRGAIGESRHRELELAAAYRDAEAQIGLDVRATYATAAAAARQAVHLRDRVLPVARRAYQIALASYRLGHSSTLEVLDTRRTLLDVENQYTDALAAANSARADLDRATATSLETFQTGDSHDR